MRVSDAEREAAAAELREHFASGRLDQEELESGCPGYSPHGRAAT